MYIPCEVLILPKQLRAYGYRESDNVDHAKDLGPTPCNLLTVEIKEEVTLMNQYQSYFDNRSSTYQVLSIETIQIWNKPKLRYRRTTLHVAS